MKKPNFFIIGAPKCGTTSLANWLSEHPNVYMSEYKEPHFYSSDFSYNVPYNDYRSYLSLFDKVNERHLAVGEASVWYLLSEDAVCNIESDIEEAKYIVMVRNPLEMAVSLHAQMVFSGLETECSFEKAWNLQGERKIGNRVPFGVVNINQLQYKRACSLGWMVERLYSLVPKDRVLVMLLEDVRDNPRKEWARLLSFLGVPDDGRERFPVYNSAKEPKSIFIQRFSAVYAGVCQRFGISPLGTGILSFMERRNVRKKRRAVISENMRCVLKSEFEEDVKKLASLLGRNLDHWIRD